MFKKLALIITIFLFSAFNANAGSDGELILKKVKSKLSLPREILIEELNSGLAIGYDQNYIKHKVPLVGVPVGEVIRV
mgnify:CR=1 FL=1